MERWEGHRRIKGEGEGGERKTDDYGEKVGGKRKEKRRGEGG